MFFINFFALNKSNSNFTPNGLNIALVWCAVLCWWKFHIVCFVVCKSSHTCPHIPKLCVCERMSKCKLINEWIYLRSIKEQLRENRVLCVRTFGNDANTCCFTSQINRSDGNCKHLNTFNSGTWTRTNSHPSRGSGGGSSSKLLPLPPPAIIGAWSILLLYSLSLPHS